MHSDSTNSDSVGSVDFADSDHERDAAAMAQNARDLTLSHSPYSMCWQ